MALIAATEPWPVARAQGSPPPALPPARAPFGVMPDEAVDRPRPGSFGVAPNRLPGPFLKSPVVAPRTPDVELPLNERTSIGLFGEVGRVDPRSSAPVLLNRELGAGVTLQYRFGGK